ncbi:MAG TPA: translation initiation factor IF-2 N-terminal domain-containing protein, partial [Isosphaeraceae bacterium]|nr:translation initiation factor IF-2 N-terminal domain-containing protein [Isosphaeraceae bacterium]
MSTRVHELAKELGLKSQELLERIQKWGLDVKANALASLDPEMVDRIRELMDQPAALKGSATATAASAAKPAAAPSSLAASATGAPRASAGEERPAPSTRPAGPAPIAAGPAKIEPVRAAEAAPAAVSSPVPGTAPPQ